MNIVFIKLQKVNFDSLLGNEEIDVTGHVCVYPQKKAESLFLPFTIWSGLAFHFWRQFLLNCLVTGAGRQQPPMRASLPYTGHVGVNCASSSFVYPVSVIPVVTRA